MLTGRGVFFRWKVLINTYAIEKYISIFTDATDFQKTSVSELAQLLCFKKIILEASLWN